MDELKCEPPENVDYESIGENNPFYHYEFYIIQKDDKDDSSVERDDIIVIERLYEDRPTKQEFATNNATYIMRYEDLLVLQGKQKKLQHNQKRKIIQEVEGAVYVAHHKSGSWAKSVLEKIAQARAGKSFKHMTKKERGEQIRYWLKDLYAEEELQDIMDLALEIDSEQYTYINQNGTWQLKYPEGGTQADENEAR